MKDWRGTEIELGQRVITHGRSKWPVISVGVVDKINDSTITVAPLERNDAWPLHKIVIGSLSVTVLTDDMFPDLVERVATLEGDIEYYKSEVSRTW